MALYQPSNIIPSQLSGFGSGVVHSADNINISWQVNGTSGMTGYAILIFNADYANNNTSQVGETHTYSLSTPFYGTDAKGNTVFYVFPNTNTEKWSDWGLTDGNAYTMQINQKYNDGQSTRTVTQYSQSFFITRTKPTLELQNFSNAISKGECAFNAVYTQAQDDTINWARWQFALVNGATYTILDDTGTIDTGVLSYSQEGLLSGNTYAVNCIVQTQNGELVETGWQNFEVVYTSGTTSNNFLLEQKTNFNLLKWGDYQRNILGRAVGAYTISNGKIQLNAGSYVEWDTVDDEPMSFDPPFNIAFSATKTGNLYNQFALGKIQNSSCAFSPINNNLLVLGSFNNSSVSAVVLGNNGVQQRVAITKNGEDLHNIRGIAFSPNGELLVLVGNNGASVFSVNNLTFTYLYDLQIPNGTLPILYTATFNDAGTALFLGGGDSSVRGGYIFTVSDNQITYSQTIFTPDNAITSAAFVDDDSALIVGGWFNDYCVSFSITNGVYTNNGALTIASGDTPSGDTISSAVNKISVCKAKNIFVVATVNQAYWYTITNGVIEYSGVVPRTNTVNASYGVAFNHIGDTLVMYGGYSASSNNEVNCYVNIYQVTDTDIVYKQSKLFSVNPNGEIDSLLDCAFSADDVALAVLTNSAANSFCYYTLDSQNSFMQFNSNDVALKAGKLSVVANNEIIGEVPIPYYLILQNKLDFVANIFADSVFMQTDNIERKVNYSVPIADSQISNIRLYGDLTCDWLTIEKSVDSNIITAQPTWNVNTYMLAHSPKICKQGFK
uniref:Translation initiation factor-like protein n=1 Tax=Siphoviridae sp. ctnMR5 TaxID=2825658 RepID=A0A8S5U8V0_9CAUD|nr:MAG TPA: translation initiation factor-like protein [Siphoviridae sp. ctnMR5]